MESFSSSFFDEAAVGLIPSSHYQPQQYYPYSHNPYTEDLPQPLLPPSPLTPATTPETPFFDLFADIDTTTVDPRDLMEFFPNPLFTHQIPPTLPPSPPRSTPSTSSRLSLTPTPPPPTTSRPRPRQRKPRKDVTYGCTSPTCDTPFHAPPIPSLNHHHHIADDPMHKKRMCCRYPECDVCPGFVTPKDRKRHEDSKHKTGQGFTCTVCGFEMARLDNMKVHVRNTHPGLTEEEVGSKISKRRGR